MKTVFVSVNSIGSGLSGGDNIFIELIRGWSSRMDVILLGSEEARGMAARKGVSSFSFICSSKASKARNPYSLFDLLRHNVTRIADGYRVIRDQPGICGGADAVYSASDAYPDLLPALRMKLRNPSIKWIAGYYLFVPPPWARVTPYKGRHFLRGLCYWLLQTVSYRLVKRWADVVMVTSEPDVARFVTAVRPASRVVVVRGGVDISASSSWLQSPDRPDAEKKYDACFMGRLHYQKGVLELVDIWARVAERRPGARLAVIGDGPLEGALRDSIEKKQLDACIDLLGFLDGDAKYAIFRQSRVVVHPAVYDSGGMAAAEAMAWGLPGVSFDLEALKTYYPMGMLKTAPGDTAAFAENICRLLDDSQLYERMSGEAVSLIREEWSWSIRADQIYRQVFEL